MGKTQWDTDENARKSKINNHKPYDINNVDTSPEDTLEFDAEEWLKSIQDGVKKLVQEELAKAEKDPTYIAKTKEEIEKSLLDQKISGKLSKARDSQLQCYKAPPNSCCQSYFDNCGGRRVCKDVDWYSKCACTTPKYQQSPAWQAVLALAKAAWAKIQAGKKPTDEETDAYYSAGGTNARFIQCETLTKQNQNGVVTRGDRKITKIKNNPYNLGTSKSCHHQFIFIIHRPNPPCSYPWFEMAIDGCRKKWWPIYVHLIQISVKEMEMGLSSRIVQWLTEVHCGNSNTNDTADPKKTSNKITIGNGKAPAVN
jgi:hypothetical protein